MRATEFMTTPVVTVTAQTSISEADALLLDQGFSAMPVVDDQQRLVGMVSEADLLRGRVPADPWAHLLSLPVDNSEPPHEVREVMTDTVFALPESADEADFAAAMIEHRFKSIPVVAGRRVVGIVSASDLLRTQVRGDEEIARAVRARLREYAGGRDVWSVDVSDGVVTLAGRVPEPHGRVAVLLAETVPGAVRVRTSEGELAEVGQPVAPEPAATPRSEEPSDRRGLRVLGLEECLDRLREAPVGRLAFNDQGGPVVLPVNHAVDHLDIVFRTTWGSKLRAAEGSGPVAFQVDGIDEDRRTGWSVLVKGTASIVYEEPVTDRLESLAVRSWAGIEDDTFWVRIRADEITGREIVVGP